MVDEMSKKHFMTTGSYYVVADCIRKIEDASLRKLMADHFAQYFHDRSDRFDNNEWFRATGGLAKAKSQ